MSSLPYDILLEVHYRLPVKSLVRFQVVSKQWHSLISDPKFAEKQAEINNSQRILMVTPGRFQSLDVVQSLECVTASFCDLNSPFPFKRKYDGTNFIIGSCNGLVCMGLHEYKDFFIWNPTTGVYKKLPNPDIPFESQYTYGFPFEPQYIYGFGYDSSTDDYKVVVATRCRKPNLVQVFSLKINSWRNIQDDIGVIIYTVPPSRGLLVNGALHWLIPAFIFRSPGPVIFAFDLAEEKFRRFDKPCHSKSNSLGVVGGCLSLNICGYKTDYELLVMKEYGVESSWERLAKVEAKEVVDYYGTVCTTSSGEIIMTNSKYELAICNPKERTILTIHRPKSNLCQKIAYTESLVSPNYN